MTEDAVMMILNFFPHPGQACRPVGELKYLAHVSGTLWVQWGQITMHQLELE